MKYYKQIDINSWEEFKALVDKFPPDIIYRGQSDSDWELESAWERAELEGLYYNIEERLIKDFKRIAHYYLHNQEMPKTNLAWLALIQHHGTPTRLIDFTKSPYIASYFAFENLKNKSKHVAIWCVNKSNLYKAAFEIFQKKFKISEIISGQLSYFDSFFDKIKNLHGFKCVIPFEIEQHNERYYLQQSIFLVPCRMEIKTREQFENIQSIIEDSIIKITLPREIYKSVLRDLYKMNITPASLFPSLDGYAKTINMMYTITHSYKEFVDNYLKLKDKGIK